MQPRRKTVRIALAMIIAAGGSFLSAQIPPQKTVGAKPGAPTSSTSASGQFSVHGADMTMRSAFCVLCDETAVALGRLLHDDARYLLPVVVVLKTPPDVTQTGPAVGWNISQLAHGGFHLQVNAQLRGDFRGDDFSRELVRLLVAERILRNHKELKTSRQSVLPNWVLIGVTQALEFRSRSRPSALFAAVFRNGQVFSVDKILAADPAQLDALARSIYEASSCALVLALLDQQDGSLRFAKFLDSLAVDSKSDRDLLRQHFPTLGASKNSLEKWWTLQMATLATPSPLETLSSNDTDAKLDEALTLVFDPKTPEDKKKEAADKAKSDKDEKRASEKKKTSWNLADPRDLSAKLLQIMDELASSITGRFVAAAKEADAETKPEEKPLKLRADPHRLGKKPANLPETPEMIKAREKAALEKKKKDEADKKKADAEKVKAEAAAKKKAEEDKKKSDLAEKKNMADAKKKPEAEKKSAEAKTEDEPKKRNGWNPVNWFRKSEKPAEEPKKEGSAKGKAAAPKNESNADPERSASRMPSSSHDGLKVSGPPIEEFAALSKRSDRAAILQRNIDLLTTLKVQAHPLYRELIGEYIDAVRLIATGKDRKLTEKLAALHERRNAISQQSLAVESHLDWYEASQTRSYSGMFDDYLKLHDKLDKEIRTRSDAISKYLDLLQKEYED